MWHSSCTGYYCGSTVGGCPIVDSMSHCRRRIPNPTHTLAVRSLGRFLHALSPPWRSARPAMPAGRPLGAPPRAFLGRLSLSAGHAVIYPRPPPLALRSSPTAPPRRLHLAEALTALLRFSVPPLWLRIVLPSTRPQPFKHATCVSARCRRGLPVPSRPIRTCWCHTLTRRRRAAQASASRVPLLLVIPLVAAMRLAMGRRLSSHPPRR